MPVGIQPSLAQLNQQAGQIILQARAALQQILFFNLYLQTLGQAGLTTDPLNATVEDATNLLATFLGLAAIANVCNGGAYEGPALPYNFLASTADFWGGN